jgi:signal recognition particle receptor subunit beta
LRHYAYSAIEESFADANARPHQGIIFAVDSANISGAGNSAVLGETAAYLHDVLLALQRIHTSRKTSKGTEIPFLIAATKADLFTSLPPAAVKTTLENEITKIRRTRAAGIAAVGSVGKAEGLGGEDEGAEEELEPLGGATEGKFEFRIMEEWNVHVEVRAGNVVGEGEEGPGVEGWWDWVAAQM